MQHATHHRGLAAQLARALEWIDIIFCKLNRIQFSAPWKSDRSNC